MIDNKVKLVVWDLDDTFWHGTLSEEGISPVARNIAIVIELPKRGILNSICSKNDPDQVKAKLNELGVWDQFVFPSIGFNPKGKAVAEMIEAAALRAENVLFIDDNRLNLEEVKFFNPGIMACHPQEVLEGFLDHPNLAGKPDPELTRLKQYRFLQRKVEDRGTTDLSNEEFLRASNIRVEIDYDVESNFDRVVDLINRANQLNYTKQRLNTTEEIEKFRASLGTFGVHAGCVRARDNYGDYGLIGFFFAKLRANKRKLIHFVFSCRTMNMGIEQYVYELLDQPSMEIIPPTSYGLDSHAAIDWIRADGEPRNDAASESDSKLLLLGGCDLLQLASYCSSNRAEFVNVCRGEHMVRFDDPGFILSDRASLRASETIRRLPSWQYEDAVKFDEAAASSNLILVSLWAATNAPILKIDGEILLALKVKRTKQFEDQDWFKRGIEMTDFSAEDKMALILRSFDALASRSMPGSQIFVLGCYTLSPDYDQPPKRQRVFNKACREYCERRPESFRYVDLDAVMPPDSLIQGSHFARTSYFALARHIMERSAHPVSPAAPL
jgi:FkbH-like protein